MISVMSVTISTSYLAIFKYISLQYISDLEYQPVNKSILSNYSHFLIILRNVLYLLISLQKQNMPLLLMPVNLLMKRKEKFMHFNLKLTSSQFRHQEHPFCSTLYSNTNTTFPMLHPSKTLGSI